MDQHRQNQQAPLVHSVRTEGHVVCRCGQELDTCRHEHCPRCGHRIDLGVALAAT